MSATYDKIAKQYKAHLALAELEEMGIVRQVITQNIDGLHKKAGVGLSRILMEIKKIAGI